MDIPPPMQLTRPSQSDINYRLIVLQNPIRARASGFGEKDRRPIDPPPIIQIVAENSQGEPVEIPTRDSTFFVVQCELYNKERTETRSIVYTPKAHTKQPSDHYRNLVGSTVSNAYHLYDPDNKQGVYFIFHNLCVRTEGNYTLKFLFISLAAGEPMTMTTSVQDEVFSEPFCVYSAKKFPGLTGSTLLSKCFSKQGIKIPIRHDPPYKRIENMIHREEHYNKEDEEVQQQQQKDNEEAESTTNSSSEDDCGGESSSTNQTQRQRKYKRISISEFLSPE
ncbi:MAG: velvet factor-domain-containing protein [Benjaminiella poitrasii]|nr:MAG: velvet factor-domain-containing protein [Benjaminiella poitrasii]